MKLKRQRLNYLLGVMIVLCVGLSGFTVYELVRPNQIPHLAYAANQDAQAAATMVDETGSDIPFIEAFAEIVERPLFMENRRPYSAPAPIVINEPEPQLPVEPDITEQIILRATIIIGEKRIALIQELANGKQLRLSQGEQFNGWTLAGVETNAISMKKGDEVKQIELKKGQS